MKIASHRRLIASSSGRSGKTRRAHDGIGMEPMLQLIANDEIASDTGRIRSADTRDAVATSSWSMPASRSGSDA